MDHLAESVRQHCPASAYALITDSIVATHYRKRVSDSLSALAPCHVFEFAAGEANKTRETWYGLTDAMLKAGLGRDTAVVALGGGVVGDVAGFVAATYNRGIDYVQIPTTLLAMVDSSIGGKTGVDTDRGKNLVGSFHQPKLVVADVATLRTLPASELTAGIAETLKHGAIADSDYFDWIDEQRSHLMALDLNQLGHLVKRSVEIKATVVGQDEREMGCRATLNFGHTIGHGIEAASSYNLLHGQAVAIGMVCEARAGEELGITEAGVAGRIEEVAAGFDLPVKIPGRISVEAAIGATRTDKKNRGGKVRFSPICRIGQSARGKNGSWTFEITQAAMKRALTAHGS